jgi:hypothetical protein
MKMIQRCLQCFGIAETLIIASYSDWIRKQEGLSLPERLFRHHSHMFIDVTAGVRS